MVMMVMMVVMVVMVARVMIRRVVVHSIVYGSVQVVEVMETRFKQTVVASVSCQNTRQY